MLKEIDNLRLEIYFNEFYLKKNVCTFSSDSEVVLVMIYSDNCPIEISFLNNNTLLKDIVTSNFSPIVSSL